MTRGLKRLAGAVATGARAGTAEAVTEAETVVVGPRAAALATDAGNLPVVASFDLQVVAGFGIEDCGTFGVEEDDSTRCFFGGGGVKAPTVDMEEGRSVSNVFDETVVDVDKN